MKKSVIIFVILTLNFELITLNCFAQPNAGFESWSNVYGVINPDSWQTLNFLSNFTDPLSAFKATGADKHTGDFALKLTTVYLNINPAPNALQDTIGAVFTGKVILSPASLRPGIPYTGRPEKLGFWCKYSPVGDDYAGVFVGLQKWNGNGHDTIAYGDITIHSTLTYSYFEFALNYRSTESPDTITIGIESSYKKSKARVGSTIYIDDLALTGWVDIDESTNFANKVKIFPNPAKDNITILAQIDEADNVQVVDVSGKFMGAYKIQNYGANINTSIFAEGIYLFEIRDKKEIVLTNGKFSVAK